MNFEEQNQLAESLSDVIFDKLKGNAFHVVIAIENEGKCFSFSTSSLSEESRFQSCKLLVKGISEETQTLLDKFRIPSDEKLKRPIEPK